MEPTLLVLRTDLVVFVAGAPISQAQAHAAQEAFAVATDGDCRLVVIPTPARVVDLRDADPELLELAERIAARMPELVA